jgi:hypothetical protein
MKAACISTSFFFLCTVHAQHTYFAGFGIKGTVMNEASKEEDWANLFSSAAVHPADYQKTKLMKDDPYNPSGRMNQTCMFLGVDMFFRFNDTRNMLKWTEWIVGINYMNPGWYYAPDRYVYKDVYTGDTLHHFMRSKKTRHSGLMLETKMVFNSSPYRGRLMKHIGLGFRMGMFEQKRNVLEYSQMHFQGKTAFMTSQDVEMSTTPSTMLSLFGVLGLKYNVSCLFTIYSEMSLGYYTRFYAEKIKMDGSIFTLSLGVKYKLGNNIDPTPSISSDEANPKKDRKKMQVYW